MRATKAVLDTNNRMLRRELELARVALDEEREKNAETDRVIADLRMRAESAERLLQDESRARHRWEALSLLHNRDERAGPEGLRSTSSGSSTTCSGEQT